MSAESERTAFTDEDGVAWTPDVDGWEAQIYGLRCTVYEAWISDGMRWVARVDCNGGDWVKDCESRKEAVKEAGDFAYVQSENARIDKDVDTVQQALHEAAHVRSLLMFLAKAVENRHHEAKGIARAVLDLEGTSEALKTEEGKLATQRWWAPWLALEFAGSLQNEAGEPWNFFSVEWKHGEMTGTVTVERANGESLVQQLKKLREESKEHADQADALYDVLRDLTTRVDWMGDVEESLRKAEAVLKSFEERKKR